MEMTLEDIRGLLCSKLAAQLGAPVLLPVSAVLTLSKVGEGQEGVRKELLTDPWSLSQATHCRGLATLDPLAPGVWVFHSLFLISHFQGPVDALGPISNIPFVKRNRSHILTPPLTFEIRDDIIFALNKPRLSIRVENSSCVSAEGFCGHALVQQRAGLFSTPAVVILLQLSSASIVAPDFA